MIRMLWASLRFYWRRNLGIFLGTVLAASLLIGSLLMGDSIDGSLRKFAMQRLGNVHYAMQMPNRFFTQDLARRMGNECSAVLALRGMAMTEQKQINRVQVLGTDPAFWAFVGLDIDLSAQEIILNEKLAEALNAEVGDEISLRIEKPSLLSGDAPLSAQQKDRYVRARFSVVRVLGDHEMGRFSLSANQVIPYNAFVQGTDLATRVELDGKANILLTGSGGSETILPAVWHPRDFGLTFRTTNGITQLEAESIYLEPEVVRAAMAIPEGQGTLTYLVNSISAGKQSTPYSFVLSREGAGLADHEIIINRWLADELDVGVGDAVVLNYSELQTSSKFVQKDRTFQVKCILEMEEFEPERLLAPQFPGLTDVDRCSDWDVGIPMKEELLEDEANEAYWNTYKQTPKAIISLNTGQAMWANRFGSLTAVRWPSERRAETAFTAEFNPAGAGYSLRPVREHALAAVNQAMDFGQLFVGMSFFLIIVALMLTGLLFVFGIQERAEEMGILLATGWKTARVRCLLLLEGSIIALGGSICGAIVGIGYTQLLIIGLSQYWQGAIAHSSVHLFVRSETVITGAVAAFVCALVAMAIAVWHLTGNPARELLMGDFSQPHVSAVKAGNRMRASAIICGIVAMGLGAFALFADVRQISILFFAAGGLLLVACILFCSVVLKKWSLKSGSFGLMNLALKNAARRMGRSLTVIGLLACGCFLVFSVSSMKEDLRAHARERNSGTGGFAWFGESTLALNDDAGDVRLRIREGDDASCLNLNRAQSPRLLGVDPEALTARKAFTSDENFWALLNLKLPGGKVPALVGDSDTALWGLDVAVGPENGAEFEYTDDSGQRFNVKLVGKLPMRLSIFQGSFLVAERQFIEHFSSEEGYRMFLWDHTEPDTMNRKYARSGLDVVPAIDRLMEFYAVETTYLSMFLVLGILGLMVGSLGMGIVVLRNVQDRRPEQALLLAVGYRPALLKKLLLIEHGVLIVAGLGGGVVSAALAMIPALFISHSKLQPGFLFGLFLLVVCSCVGCMVAAVLFSVKANPLRGLRGE